MKYKTILDQEGNQHVAIEHDHTWKILQGDLNLLDCLDKKVEDIEKLPFLEYQPSAYKETIPFRPAAYRDFMLYEKHAIDAARGFVRKYMSKLFPIVNTYEKVFQKPFPKLKPKKRYYKHPIYYMVRANSFRRYLLDLL